MQVPEGWEDVECIRIHTPSENYYVLQIINVIEGRSKNGNELLRMEFDIAEGEFKGYYTMMGAKNNRNLLLQYHQLTQKKSALSFFKTMLRDVEESNEGYKWDFSYPAGLKGKRIGAYLRLEPYINKEGKQREILKIDRLYPVAFVVEKLAKGVTEEIQMRRAERARKREEAQQQQQQSFYNKQEESFDDLPFH